jgi:hypothetical protein
MQEWPGLESNELPLYFHSVLTALLNMGAHHVPLGPGFSGANPTKYMLILGITKEPVE